MAKKVTKAVTNTVKFPAKARTKKKLENYSEYRLYGEVKDTFLGHVAVTGEVKTAKQAKEVSQKVFGKDRVVKKVEKIELENFKMTLSGCNIDYLYSNNAHVEVTLIGTKKNQAPAIIFYPSAAGTSKCKGKGFAFADLTVAENTLYHMLKVVAHMREEKKKCQKKNTRKF